MKKILFAAQVFGIIALFPIIVFLEMNHATGGACKNQVPSTVEKNPETTSICLPKKAKDEMVNGVFFVTIETLLEDAY